MSLKKFLFLGLVLVTACESGPKRDPASTSKSEVATAQTVLSGIRINPVRYTLAPMWKVQLHDGKKNQWSVGDLKLTSYELGDTKSFVDFKSRILELQNIDKAEAERKGKKNKGFFPKGARLALAEIVNLNEALDSGTLREEERNDALQAVAELSASFNYNFKYPIDNKTWIGAAPLRILDELSNPSMANKAAPSMNVVALDSKDDLSTINPPDSSFWRRPGDIASKELYYGFGRTKLLTFPNICKYKEPKDGYGASGGLEIVCADTTYKVKFGDEMNSEPFNARLIWAMGFNALPVDNAVGIRLAYNRKIFSEYNSREKLEIDINSLFGFKYFSIHINEYLDPFADAISGVYLKDGTFVSPAEFKKNVLRGTKKKDEEKDENYDTTYESKVNYVVLKSAAVETKLDDKVMQNVGPWSWDALDHQKRRETRGFGTLAAFLNLYDARLDNNKLRVATDAAGRKQLLHFVSDIGSGMGNASGPIANFDGNIDQYPWEFIAKRSDRAPRMATERGGPPTWRSPFVMKGYNVIQENQSFRETQVDDARWLARKLALISEAQFQDMMIAAGFSAAEVKLGVAKLVSRRENLIDIIGLRSEIPRLREGKIDRKFDYDPRLGDLPSVQNHTEIKPVVGKQQVLKGRLRPY